MDLRSTHWRSRDPHSRLKPCISGRSDARYFIWQCVCSTARSLCCSLSKKASPCQKKTPPTVAFPFFFLSQSLSASCALFLALLSQFLKEPQTQAKELYRSKQLLLAARILSYDGSFTLLNENNVWVPAIYDRTQKILVPSETSQEKAKNRDILELLQTRVQGRLTDLNGNLYTFAEADLEVEPYLEEHAATGYAHLPFKLVYVILPNLPPEEQSLKTPPYGYVLPVHGAGLWSPIYGYLGVEADGSTVLGMTWYDQKETPGLGAKIGTPDWQKQFRGKQLFQRSSSEPLDLQRSSIGLQVLQSTIKDANLSPIEAQSAVDGIAGATFTVNGVNDGLQSCLESYRAFLAKASSQKGL